jgi:hypothetical protein
MPVDLRVTYANGASDRVRLPVEIWIQGNRYVYVRPSPAQPIKVELDPDLDLPDVRRDNNVWIKR